MQQDTKTEQEQDETDALLKLPATRWDRLVAVLEINEPERAIDAPHILERAKKLHMTDMDLFYLLLLHYQDNMSVILLDVLSLYAMMSTWVEWIKQVQRCFDIKKGKVEPSTSRSAPPAGISNSRPATSTEADFQFTSRSGSNLGGSQHTSPLTNDSLNTNASDANSNATLRDSNTRNGRSTGRSNVRNHRSKAGRAGHVNNLHCCFDLGAEWEWDGSLDFLRDGHVLSNLVEEALEHCGKLGNLQDDHRAHPEALNRGTYDILYPSLADIDRLSKDPAGGGGGGGSANGRSSTAAFDPVSYLSTFNRSRLSRDRRGTVPASKALKLIEQQGRNLAAAEHWVTRLNGMCEHFLGWKKAAHQGELFMDICNSDTLVRPLNADDKRLLHRLHWLAVALYRTVKDSSIIPAPPRMSFIVCSDDFTGVLDTSEEDNEISLLVATKCSCLPLNTKLSVTMKNFNTIQLKHPKMVSGPETLPCTLVQGETYVFYDEYHVFMPIWCVLQYYIRKYDGIPWRFEPNRQERDREVQVLGKNSSNPRLHVDPSATDYGASNSSSGAVFDLTVQSSTVRRGRNTNHHSVLGSGARHGNSNNNNNSHGIVNNSNNNTTTNATNTASRANAKGSELSMVSRRVRNAIPVPPVGAETIGSPDARGASSISAQTSPLPGQSGAAKNVAFATVRRNRVTAAAMQSPGVSLTAPPAPSPPRPPLSPSTAAASLSAAVAAPSGLVAEASVAETVETTRNDSNSEGVSPTTDSYTTGDLASNAMTNTSSIMSSATPKDSRQVTSTGSAIACSAQLFPNNNGSNSNSAVVAGAGRGGSAFANAEPPAAASSRDANGDALVAVEDAATAVEEGAASQQPLAGEGKEGEAEEESVSEPDGAATAVITPACTISCSPSSQAMVTRENFNYTLEEDEEEYEGEGTTEASTMMYSESRKMLRNFTASVVQESERNGIAIFSHHFRVSGGPIGKGAFGAVYKALNLDTGRIVAVKQSRVSYDDKTTDLNWREFQTWSMLPLHANVIIFYGASKEVDTHQLLLVMEYASGGSIVQLYRQFRPIPEPLFYDHACGMARGIKHLHDHNVIHGDVKPENVLTRSDGSVAITDFGCSRCSIVNSDSDSSSLRRTQRDSASWQLFGTAAYMAPEVILNEPHLKSDVWAYACTLLQLWLGRSPWSGGERRFSAQDSIPLMFYIANEEVVPFTEEQIENTPRWLQRIAQRSFEREVEKRCSMGEIIGILNEYSRAYVQ